MSESSEEREPVADAAPLAIEYETRSAPPRLERSPGRVALVLPPAPRWTVVLALVVSAALTVLAAAYAAAVWVLWARVRGLPVARAALPGLAFWTIGAVFCLAFLASTSYWAVKMSHALMVVEVADGWLTLTTPGMLRASKRRAPLAQAPSAQAPSVTARDIKVCTGSAYVDVRIQAGRAFYVRRFVPSPRPGFAAEITSAFAEAMRDVREPAPGAASHLSAAPSA